MSKVVITVDGIGGMFGAMGEPGCDLEVGERVEISVFTIMPLVLLSLRACHSRQDGSLCVPSTLSLALFFSRCRKDVDLRLLDLSRYSWPPKPLMSLLTLRMVDTEVDSIKPDLRGRT